MKMKSMRGATVLGILTVALVIIFVMVIAIQLVPPYLQHYELKSIVADLVKEPNVKDMSNAQIKEILSRRFQMNNIKNVPLNALIIEKKEGNLNLYLDYEVRVHVIGNLDAMIKFNHEAANEGGG